jgi:accessory Sec system glycosylation protein GtfA
MPSYLTPTAKAHPADGLVGAANVTNATYAASAADTLSSVADNLAAGKQRVLSINKAIGYASSGVEYAQKYRHQLLKDLPWADDYYIFTDYISTNICVFSDLMGFPRDRIIWIYNYLAGRRTLPCTLVPEDFKKTLGQDYTAIDGISAADNHYTDLVLTDAPVRYRIWKTREHHIDRVDTIISDQLERVDHYDQSLNNTEYYQGGQLIRRTFFTSCGDMAFEQFYENREITQTIIDGAIIDGRSLFLQYFFKKLFNESGDVVIVDRTLDVIDAVYPVVGNNRLFSVVHAEHYHLGSEKDALLWNNHYEHVFAHADKFEGIIVSTDKQKKMLEAQLEEQGQTARIVHIPVGSVAEVASSEDYAHHSLLTASRLADEKHIDLLIKAVIEARKSIPDITLDIYGEGKRADLEKLITDTESSSFTSLKGHQDLTGEYAGYALYVTASGSEGFGLSLMEAIAEGLPIVGFDVDYGNREMVEDGVNGLLIPYTKSSIDVTQLAAGIVQVLQLGDQSRLRQASAKRARTYLDKAVRQRWEALLLGWGKGVQS